MFNFVKNFIVKTVKFVLGLTALLVVIVVAAIYTDDGTSTADQKKIKELTQPKKEVVVVKKEEIKKPVVLTVEQKIKKQESRIAFACTKAVKSSVTYPSKVDPNWGYDARAWKDFSGKNNHRYLITRKGEMMNGFGNMVPYTAVCKVDWNHITGDAKLIEFFLNNQLLVSQK